MQNSKFDPKNLGDFEKSKLQFYGQKSHGTIPAGTTANIDYTLTEDCLLTGANIRPIGHDLHDTMKLQVVHPIYGVVKEFADWYARDIDKETKFPAKLPTGLTIRVVFTSTGSTDVEVFINWDLYMVLE
jgi:hypothetical protein